MAEQNPPEEKAESCPKLILKSGISSVNKKYSQDNTDIVFKNRETGQEKRAHKTVLSVLSPFFSTWFKEEWEQDKDRTEYPVPGDIEWEIFSNVISFLYGHQVEFEEDTLPDLFKAADYLQLDSLKVAIIESIPDQWELKDPSIAGAMCTAVASQTHPRVISGWLYTVSVRYLIRNIQMIVDNDTIDLSPLPYDVMMEIAQSEEIRAPEVQLYHFLRMWAKPLQQKLTHEEVQKLFGHVRYGTIPYTELEQIVRYSLKNDEKFWVAFSGDVEYISTIGTGPLPDVQQIASRKRQEAICLLTTSEMKKWTGKIVNTSLPIYAIVSGPWNGAITLTWSTKENIPMFANPVSIEVLSLSSTDSTNLFVPKYTVYSDERDTLLPGFMIRSTSEGIEVELLRGTTLPTAHTGPYPLLIMIEVQYLQQVTVQT